jgi:hypothetical protein
MKVIKKKNIININKNSFRNITSVRNNKNKIKFYSLGNNIKDMEKFKFNNILENNSNNNNFPITNNTSEHNFYINHEKTMVKLNKSQGKKTNKTYIINNLIYHKRNKSDNIINGINDIKTHYNKPINLKSISNSLSNERYKNNKNEKEEFFPSFNYLNPEIKESYKSLIDKTKTSLLFMKDKDLNIDNEIANLNATNYITDRVFISKRYNSNDNKIFSYESNNKKFDLDLPFIEKQTIYKGLNNIRLKYPNPVYKSRIENFLNDFHKMINLYKTNIKNN